MRHAWIRSLRSVVVAGLALFPLLGVAKEAVNPFEEADESELFRSERESVTVASRYAQSIRQAPSIVSVISDQEIRSRGYRTLGDVLGDIPGIHITVAKESRSLAWFRGLATPDNNKFLLLIDGVPWYDGVYTHAWLDEYISLSNVKQVEVIKGPGSAIYGTNAFGGVVNVVTYTARDLQGGFFRAEGGSHGHLGGSAVFAESWAWRGETVEVQANTHFMGREGDGVDVIPKGRLNVMGENPRRSVGGGFGLQVGKLDLRADFIHFQHTYFLTEQDDWEEVVKGNLDVFGTPYENQMFSARYHQRLGFLGKLTPNFFFQNYNNTSVYPIFGDSEVTVNRFSADGVFVVDGGDLLIMAEKKTQRMGGGVDVELHPWPYHTLVAGVGTEGTHVLSLEDFSFEEGSHEPSSPAPLSADPAWIHNTFGYAQHTWMAGWWLELTGGARLDYHSHFGSFVSPRAGILFMPSMESTIKVLYGRAFRAPNVRELLVDVGVDDDGGNLYTSGNPNLMPEEIDTVEVESTVGVGQRVEFRIGAFGSLVQEVIDTKTDGTGKLGDNHYANLDEAELLGAEGQVEVLAGAAPSLNDWKLSVGASVLHAVDGETGNKLYGVPNFTGLGRVTWAAVDGVRVSVGGRYVGAQPRDEWTPDSRLADGEPYALIDLGVATDVLAGGRVRVDLSIRNLLNTEYDHMIFLEDANVTTTDDSGATVAKYPEDIEGTARTAVVGMEMRF